MTSERRRPEKTTRAVVAAMLVACAGQKREAVSPAPERTPKSGPAAAGERVPAEKWAPSPAWRSWDDRTTSFGRERREKPKTQVWIGAPSYTGELDASTLRRYLRRQKARFWYCHAKEQVARPELGFGRVTLTFTIDGSGSVIAASGTGFDQTVTDCLVGAVRGIAFPKPSDGQSVAITSLSVTFDPPP